MLKRILVLCLAISPVWAEIQVEMLNAPADGWSKQVDNVWRLRIKDAVKTYRALTEPGLGELDQDVRFYLAVNAEEAKQIAPQEKYKSFILNFDGKQQITTVKTKPYSAMASALAMVQMQELAKSQLNQTHEWLRFGTAAWIAIEVLAKHSDQTVESSLQSMTYWLRNTKETPDPASFINGRDGLGKKTGFSNTAILMTYHLKTQLGDKYFPALSAYLRQAGKPGFDANQAFEQHFDRSVDAFLQSYQQWAVKIKNEQLAHKNPIPAASGYATLDQTERYPLEDDAARKGLASYIKARAPKALALSSRGAWSYRLDSVDAMEQALTACRRHDPVSCRLYAVDDAVVYQPPIPGEAKIEVRMASLGDDGWTEAVREKFRPIALQATEALRKLVRDQMGLGLDETVRVHLASGTDDYTRVLQEELGMSEQNANDFSILSGGMANGRGQIAIPVLTGYTNAGLMERVAKTPAHEIVHELQGQIAKRYKGFHSPAWILEGSANLLAYEAVEAAKLPDSEELTKKAWHKKNVEWYQRDGSLQPEEIQEPEGVAWKRFMSKRRGPYELAGLMVYRLQEKVGDGFYKAWVNYYQLAGVKGQKEEAAFEQSFGMTREVFFADFKEWAKKL